MKFNKIKIIFYIFFLFNIISFLSVQPVYANVKITGKRAEVELDDILYPGRKITGEIEIRKICAEIIEKYNNKGFTAFRIKNAVLKNDGTLELIFSDPVVEHIFIIGGNERIGAEIYVQSEAFNELVLNENIVRIKKNYPVKKVMVDLKRNDNDNIDLYITVESRFVNGTIIAASDPVYGGLTSATVSSVLNSSVISAALDTTAEIREVRYTKAGIDYMYNLEAGNMLSLLVSIWYNEKDNYLDESENSLYTERNYEGKTGLRYNKYASSISLTFLSFLADYNGVPGLDNRYCFTGFSADYKYNDNDYRIDPLDVLTTEINYISLWNPVEKKMESRFFIKGSLTIPVAYSCSLSLFIVSNYTSEHERIFHSYVFDRNLPLRNQEYTLTKWRNVARTGLLFDIYNRFVFISPEYILGIYEDDGQKKIVHATSFRGILRTSLFTSQIAYILESGEPVTEGVLTFEAGAVF